MRAYLDRPVVVMHPITGEGFALRDGEDVLDDEIVRAFPWAFVKPIETATAGPGERRDVRR